MDEQKKFIYVNVNGKKVRYVLQEDGSYCECTGENSNDCNDCDAPCQNGEINPYSAANDDEEDLRFNYSKEPSSGESGRKKRFFKREKSMWEFFPTASFCIILYLCLGFVWGLWHPGWLVFLLVPIVISVFEKGLKGFPYPIFTVGVFLCLGCIWGYWHPGWLVFLTVPIYYTILSSKSFPAFLHSMYPLFTVIVYLVLGFSFNLWHPGWLIFLTIPIFNGFAEMVRHSKRK